MRVGTSSRCSSRSITRSDATAEFGATGGDYAQMIANALRWASRQPDPTGKPMPITLDPFEIAFKDDHPTTTTPRDSFPIKVEVRDDDHGKVRVTSSSQLSFD